MIPDDYQDIEFRKYFLRDFYEGYFKQNGFVPYRTEWVIWSSEIASSGKWMRSFAGGIRQKKNGNTIFLIGRDPKKFTGKASRKEW